MSEQKVHFLVNRYKGTSALVQGPVLVGSGVRGSGPGRTPSDLGRFSSSEHRACDPWAYSDGHRRGVPGAPSLEPPALGQATTVPTVRGGVEGPPEEEREVPVHAVNKTLRTPKQEQDPWKGACRERGRRISLAARLDLLRDRAATCVP